MNPNRLGLLIASAVLGVILLNQSVYVINEYEQAIVTRLQKYKRTVKDAGLHWKWPFVESAIRFDKRVLARDAVPGEYLTKDKKRLLAESIAGQAEQLQKLLRLKQRAEKRRTQVRGNNR